MKYLYIGVGLLLVMLAISLLCLWQLSVCSDAIAKQLEQAISAYDSGQMDASISYARTAEAMWHEKEGFLCSLLDHMETDSIHWNFSDIRSYMTSGPADEFRASCAEALAMVRHLKEMELPYFYNIL